MVKINHIHSYVSVCSNFIDAFIKLQSFGNFAKEGLLVNLDLLLRIVHKLMT